MHVIYFLLVPGLIRKLHVLIVFREEEILLIERLKDYLGFTADEKIWGLYFIINIYANILILENK